MSIRRQGPSVAGTLEVNVRGGGNVAFYLTAGLMILYLHYWFSGFLLVFFCLQRLGKTGRQPPGVGHLGGRGYAAAADPRRNRLCDVARGF